MVTEMSWQYPAYPGISQAVMKELRVGEGPRWIKKGQPQMDGEVSMFI